MEKSKFEKFINKYNLNGACESVIIKCDDTTTQASGMSDDKNIVCIVKAPTMNIPSGEYPVYETKKLKALLNVINENLTVDVNTLNDTPVNLGFSDAQSEVVFVLADAQVIPPVPKINEPTFELTIDMDEKFISTFVKAKNALSDVDNFAIVSNGKTNTVDVIIGYSSLNKNTVKLKATANQAVQMAPVNFSAKYLRDILVSNKDATSGKLYISSKGMAKTTFEVDNVTATYYLIKLTT
jgi:hypothetical protein